MKIKNAKGYLVGIIIGGTLMVSFQGFAESNIGSKIEAVFAEFNLVVNGETKVLQETPLVYNGTSYLPVRSVANLLGFDVTYKKDSRTIELSDSSINGDGEVAVAPTPNLTPQPTPSPTIIPRMTPLIMTTPTPTPTPTPAPAYKAINYIQVLKLNGQNYSFNYSPFVYSDINNNYFLRLDFNVVNMLLQIPTKEYNILNTDNQFVFGTIDPINFGFKYMDKKSIYETVGQSYNNYKFYNYDRTRMYEVNLKPNEEKGIINMREFTFDNSDIIIPIKDFFDRLGIIYTISIDDKEKLMVWTIS